DREKVKELFEEILEGEPVRFQCLERVGKQGTMTRPVRRVVEDGATRRKILARARTLKEREEKWRKVYIMPDLTRVQQKEDKVLRDKVKEFRASGVTNVKILKGEVVRMEGECRELLFMPDK